MQCKMASPSNASAARQALFRIAQRLPNIVKAVMAVRGDVLAASLSKTRKVCGKPNCKCTRGEKHEVYQLCWVENGRRRCCHIRKDELARVRAAVERYRRLTRCRAELRKLVSEAASLIDALVLAQRVEPPVKSEGRRR